MRAGMLRHRITIQKQSFTQNDYGEQVGTWNDDIHCWANIMPLRGQEYFMGRESNLPQTQSAMSHRVRMRYRTLADGGLITPKEKVKWIHPKTGDTRYFQINSVINPYERNVYLDLMCAEDTD